MCGEERRGSSEAAAGFRHRLADLKRNGANVLLVGTEALDACCERLLGEPEAGPRYRLFVTTDVDRSVARRKFRAAGPNEEDLAAIVDWSPDADTPAATDTRGDSVGAAQPDDGRLFATTTVESDDLRELGVGIERTVGRLETAADGMSPAELRLCFDSVTPLLTDYERRDVRRFLLGLTETVEQVNGMAHYHLPERYESETVESIEPLFDAVVEVRSGDRGRQQRWHLTEPAIDTDWLPL